MDWSWIFLIVVVISTAIAEIFDSYFNYKIKTKEEKDEEKIQ